MNKPITVKSELLGESYTVVTHKSGLKIYVFPKDLTSSYCLIATRFGSVDNTFKVGDEKEYVTVPDGVAHFLEHKLFENEDGEDTFVKFARTGADANAYTGFLSTAYLCSCVDDLYPSLEVLLKSVFSPYFTEENVKKEQGIIAQEIRQGEDNPSNAVQYGMLEGLYEKNSVRINIAGTVPSIMKITPETLYRCHKAFYNPSNMALCVCGQATLDEVLKVADKCLHGIEPIPVVSRTVTEDKAAFRKRVTKKMQVSKPIVCIGVKDTQISSDPEERIKKDIALDLISAICFEKSSDFYASLYEDGLISPSFSTWYMHAQQFSFFSVFTDSDDPEKLYERFEEYTEKHLIDSITPENFERCRRVLYSNFIKSFDSVEEIANNLIIEFALQGADIFKYTDHVKNITIDYVKEVARELFAPEAYTMSVVEPI
ncbi:MAG: insulinase family protein [Ruminococcaceae bacterium]|nr:insulinase family protein [Oscillospiraceae bacterium]